MMGSGFQAALLHSVWRLLAGRQWQCRLSSTHLLLFIFQSLHRALHALGLGVEFSGGDLEIETLMKDFKQGNNMV